MSSIFYFIFFLFLFFYCSFSYSLFFVLSFPLCVSNRLWFDTIKIYGWLRYYTILYVNCKVVVTRCRFYDFSKKRWILGNVWKVRSIRFTKLRLRGRIRFPHRIDRSHKRKKRGEVKLAFNNETRDDSFDSFA